MFPDDLPCTRKDFPKVEIHFDSLDVFIVKFASYCIQNAPLISTFPCGKGFEPVANRNHSHSIVAGGLLVISYTTRLIPSTSFTIRLEILASRSCGRRAQSAVIKSSVVTARIAAAS